MGQPRSRHTEWVLGTIIGVGLALSFASAAGAVTNPGDPTASECQIFAQQAVNKGVTFEAELAANGGGTCPSTTTTAASVLAVNVKPAAAAVLPSAVLPKSGSNITGPVTLASLAILVGGALVIINRRRTLATAVVGNALANVVAPAFLLAPPVVTWPAPSPAAWAPPTAIS